MQHFVEKCAKEYHYDIEENPLTYVSNTCTREESSWTDCFHKIDLFGRKVHFDISAKKRTVTTIFGGCMTLIFYVIAAIPSAALLYQLFFQGLAKL